MAKLGKKYLDKNGLSYLWKKIDGRYVHIEDGKTSFADGEIIVGIAGENGVTGSGVTIGGATLSTNPTVNVVATEAAVAEEVKKINSAIEDLGSVMTFLGVTTTEVSKGTANSTATVKIGNENVTATVGDVVVYGTDKPTEYIWNGSNWQEIGKVFNDEAITKVEGSEAIDVTTTNGTSTVSLKLEESGHTAGWTAAEGGYGHIHLTQTADGLKAEYGREVLTDGDAMSLSDINEAITKASSIDWKDGTGWTGGFADYTA
jgi:hypothetical protein